MSSSRQVALLGGGGGSDYSRQMPSGLILQYPVDRYSATPIPYIPNTTVALKTPSLNLIHGNRRLFSNTAWYFKTAVTVTDLNQTDAAGNVNCASTFAISSGGRLTPAAGSGSLPAGTYTMVWTVKRNGGSDQAFGLTKDAASTRTAFTATSTFQRFSITATATLLTNYGITTSDGTTAANLIVDSVQIYAGSVDLNDDTPDTNLLLGGRNYNGGLPVYANGKLDTVTNSAWGAISFPAPKSLATGYTFQALVEDTTGTDVTQALFSSEQAFAFTSFIDSSTYGLPTQPEVNFAMKTSISGSNGSSFQQKEYIKLFGRGMNLFTWTYDGTRLCFYLNDILLWIDYAAHTAIIFYDVLFNCVNNTTGPGKYNFAGFIQMADRGWTKAEVEQSFLAQRRQAASLGQTITGDSALNFWIAEGDSNTAESQGVNGYVRRYSDAPYVPLLTANYAVSGASLVHVLGRLPYIVECIPSIRRGRKILFSNMIGTNDAIDTYGGAGTPAAGAANYAAASLPIYTTMKAMGCRVIACHVLADSNASANKIAAKNAYNATLSSWVGTYIDAVVTWSTLGTADDHSDHPTYWNADGKHVNATGTPFMAADFKAVADVVLA